MRCSICNEQYEGYGHNARPFEGRCCDDCNFEYVIPARIAEIYEGRKEVKNDKRS